MARPIKAGIDFFPLDVYLDEKFELIEAQFGLKGFAIVVKILQKIYGVRGYYCEWDEDIALLFARKNNVDCNVVSDIVSASVKRGIFNKDLYEKYGILTSKGIQERYVSAVQRRQQIEVKNEFWLISDTKIPENVNINRVNVYNNSINVCNNTQIKVKESKVNKSKVNKSKREKSAYGEYARVLLTDDEYSSLLEEYGADAEGIINFLDKKIEGNGYKYTNCYLKIKEWAADAYLTEVKQKKPAAKKGPLNNFNQPEPDYIAAEKMILERQRNF